MSPWPGVRFETDLTDRIQRQMWAGMYEPHVRECFDALLQPGNVYVDVGAHIGYHAVFAAHRVGPTGRVYAFEADPSMYERLNRNLTQFPWAQAVHGAVWSRTGELSFERSAEREESGWGTVCAVRDSTGGEHISVQAVALDDWCRDLKLPGWDAMKLDAEGSEISVLQGAANAIKQFHPALILEINGILLREAGESAGHLVELLRELGYRVFYLSFRRLVPWDAAQHSEFGEVLCVPEKRQAQILGRLAESFSVCGTRS